MRGGQVVRQWTVLRLLEGSRAGMTAEQIAEQLDGACSLRTVYRDLDALRAAGFPVTHDGEWWRIQGRSSWSVPIEPSEVLGLLVSAEVLDPSSASPLHAPLSRLCTKLEAMLTPAGRQWLHTLRAQVCAQVPGALRLQVGAEVWDALEHGRVHEEVVRVHHRKPGEARATVREVEPHGFWWNAGRPYLIARCRKVEQFRQFAVQRIERAELTGEVFERVPDFDLASLVSRGFGAGQGDVVQATLWFSSEVAHLLHERCYHPSQTVEDVDDGVIVRMDVRGTMEIAALVAGFGGHACVVGPELLRAAVERLHREGLERASSRPEGLPRVGR